VCVFVCVYASVSALNSIANQARDTNTAVEVNLDYGMRCCLGVERSKVKISMSKSVNFIF